MKQVSAMAALLSLVAAAPACGGGQPDQVVPDTVAYAPDGTLVVQTNDGLFLFDPAPEAAQKGHIALDGLPAFQQSNLYKYSLSADGTVAAVSYSSGTYTTAPIEVVLYRVPTGEVLKRFDVGPGLEMSAIALSPHGDLVAASWVSGGQVGLTMIDAATGAVVWMAASEGARALAGWSPDGATLYAVGRNTLDSVLEVYDARAGLKWSRQYSYSVVRLRATADGATLAGVARDYPCTSPCAEQYSSWSAGDGTLLAQQAMPSGAEAYGLGNDGAFTCSATDSVCAIQLLDSGGYSIRVYRTDGTDVLTLPTGAASSIALSPDGQFVALGAGMPVGLSGHNGASVYRVSDGSLVVSHSFDRPVIMH
jgi:WD40 repeat protein